MAQPTGAETQQASAAVRPMLHNQLRIAWVMFAPHFARRRQWLEFYSIAKH